MPRSHEDFVFFWRPSEPNGWASQWYPSPFRAPIKFPGADDPEEVLFPTAEHWMMVQKAVLFGDYKIARKIIAIKGVKSTDCAKVRGMGRKVNNFDDETWLNARGKSASQ
ncbi:DUF1768-domain-containing protein [Athelia psychrophila]|uniref:DUF1768-domain-containing protein n=1 Tax=Athelia psychrophila TaxID=1759441 RepID=A0A166RBI6_9AGAM|nr:DUF1768-domain-containing protein [Fibularhizoctonia sp. CBS 109695]